MSIDGGDGDLPHAVVNEGNETTSTITVFSFGQFGLERDSDDVMDM